jgi:hypothetical protein
VFKRLHPNAVCRSVVGLIMTDQFEGQFKVRDERDVNARTAPSNPESQKCLRRSGKSPIVKFGLPCGLVQR